MVGERAFRQQGQPLQQGGCFGSAMGFRHADHHVHALGQAILGLLEHGVGLAHPRGHAEEDLQFRSRLPGFFVLDVAEEFVGVGSLGFHGHKLMRSRHGVQRQIEGKGIHPGFTEEAEGSTLGVAPHELLD